MRDARVSSTSLGFSSWRRSLNGCCVLVFFLLWGHQTDASEKNSGILDVQPRNLSGPCRIRHQPQTVPVPYRIIYEWNGACKNGFAQGKGELGAFREGRLIERTLVAFESGLRNGRSVSLALDSSKSWTYEGLLKANFRNGYVCGEASHTDKNGVLLIAWEGNCRGDIRQTSNPATALVEYTLRSFGPVWRLAIVYHFIFEVDPKRVDISSFADCKRLFVDGGFSDRVAEFWCAFKL
jgi:hypothetical protein